MWPRRSNTLAPLIEAASGPKGGKILWNDALESSFKELKHMVSAEILLSYPYWKLPFRVHTDVFDKQLVVVISHNDKHIPFFYIKLSKPQHNYTTNEKELLLTVEFPKQFQVIIFGYEINLFSDHKSLIYAATQSESKRVLRW